MQIKWLSIWHNLIFIIVNDVVLVLHNKKNDQVLFPTTH